MMETERPPMYFQASTSNGPVKQQMPEQIAHQVIDKLLHNWCIQIFWATFLSVVNCCAETVLTAAEKFAEEPPKSTYTPKRRVVKVSVDDIEKKMLRHITSPFIASPMRKLVRRSSKRKVLSRPPSPQLFDIEEEC